jgi:hypothetical protein
MFLRRAFPLVASLRGPHFITDKAVFIITLSFLSFGPIRVADSSSSARGEIRRTHLQDTSFIKAVRGRGFQCTRCGTEIRETSAPPRRNWPNGKLAVAHQMALGPDWHELRSYRRLIDRHRPQRHMRNRALPLSRGCVGSSLPPAWCQGNPRHRPRCEKLRRKRSRAEGAGSSRRRWLGAGLDAHTRNALSSSEPSGPDPTPMR